MHNIKKLSIENFKSYGSKENLPLSNINFLFGPNSHGKSTALSALYILGNNLLQRDFSLSKISHIDNSPDIILRDDLVNYNSDSDTFKISCELYVGDVFTRNFGDSKDELILIPTFELEDMNSGKLKSFSLHERSNGKKALFFEITDDFVTINFDSKYYLDSLREVNPIDRIVEEGKPIRKGKIEYKGLSIDWTNLQIINNPIKLVWDEDLQMSVFEKDKNVDDEITEISDFLNEQLNNVFESFQLGWRNQNFGWIGPNRTVQNTNSTEGGEKGFIDDRFLTVAAVNEMNKWLKETESISLDYEFDLEISKTKAGLVKKEYGLKDLNSGKYLTLYEVGSGVAHVFQILLPFFSDIYGIIIQQPEIHLHPSMQVQLTRALIELSWEFDIKPKIIIETHSEHIIKTAQLEIARGLNTDYSFLNKNTLSVLYISKDNNGFSKVKKMQLDETGAFTEPWPDDFFEISGALSLERLRNSVKSKN